MGTLNKLLLAGCILSSSLMAIENVNDIKTHNYGGNNLTINILPGSDFTTKTIDNVKTDNEYANAFGIGIYSKSSLKEYYYKGGEWFWDGGVSYFLFNSKNVDNSASEQNRVNAHSGIGFTTNVNETFLTSLGSGIGYKYISTKDSNTTSSILSSSKKNTSFSNPYVYGEAAMAIDTFDYSVGLIYKLSLMSIEKGYYGSPTKNVLYEHSLRMPIQFNSGSDNSFVITPTVNVTHSRYFNENNIMLMFGYSWKYN